MTAEQPEYNQAMILRVDAVASVFQAVTNADADADNEDFFMWVERVVRPGCPLGWKIVSTCGDVIFQGWWPEHEPGSYD